MTRLGFYIVHNNRYKLVKTINVPWDFTIGGPDSDNPVIDTPVVEDFKPMKLFLPLSNIVYRDEFQIVVDGTIKMIPAEDQDIQTLYRITYGNQGIYDAVKQYMTTEEWQEFSNNENVNWLPEIDEYKDTYISYFTEEGYNQFKEKTLPLILNIFQEENIKTESFEVNIEEFVEIEDEEETVGDNEEETPIEPIQPKLSFEDWFTDYFYNKLATDNNFFDVFNTSRTYIVITEEDPFAMGFMITYKGRTVINFEEHDYRNIINAMFPKIREEMIIQDDSFGGYDDDKDFTHKKEKPDCSFGGHDDDSNFLVEQEENKGIDTYPNLF